VADILFQVDYLALSVLLTCAWYYAYRARLALIVPKMTDTEVSFLRKKFLVPFGVAVFGIVILMIGYPFPDLAYLLPFIILAVFFRQPPGSPKKLCSWSPGKSRAGAAGTLMFHIIKNYQTLTQCARVVVLHIQNELCKALLGKCSGDLLGPHRGL
jgi:hypothetical protein